MNLYGSDTHREEQRNLHLAELAERRGDGPIARAHYLVCAQINEELARLTTNPFDAGVFWSSAVACAYHAGDKDVTARLAEESLAFDMPERFRAEIAEMNQP